MSGEYENTKYVVYGEDRATFIPVCQKCGRFVKAPDSALFNFDGEVKQPEIRCSKCGASKMIFVGYV